MNVPRIYLAGAVTGRPDFNRAAFAHAAEQVTASGAHPVSPHDTPPTHAGECPPGPRFRSQGQSHPYPCWVRSGLRALLDCDAILLLDGWRRSRGARLEARVARVCGIPRWGSGR